MMSAIILLITGSTGYAADSVFITEPDHKQQVAAAVTKYAKKYKLDRSMLSCLLKTESNYHIDAISTTEDYGIGQINIRNIHAHKWSKKLLLSNVDYSVSKAAYMLSYYKWLKQPVEPRTWYCRYNIGLQRLRGTVAFLCYRYMERIDGCRTNMEPEHL